jgi:aldehyde dehydrogenase (NAD+)
MTDTRLPDQAALEEGALAALRRCGVDEQWLTGDGRVNSPINGAPLVSRLRVHDVSAVADSAERSHRAFRSWRSVPAPQRGHLVKAFGTALTERKEDLATLITLEVGKIRSEALGEVQEMIDICDLAVGLSRQLFGRTMVSERAGHRLMETWHPLGPVGVISAFNFPAAVWSWNAAIALVCGDSVVWKPSDLAPLTAIACTTILEKVAAQAGAPDGLAQVLVGGRELGEALVADPRIALVSATGSTGMGRAVGPRVADRFGRSLLELGGNNAAIVTEGADLELAAKGIVFAAAGTAGQRCTTLRRVLVHRSNLEPLRDRLVDAYRRLPVGNPLDENTLVGPLIHRTAFTLMQEALEQAQAEGGARLVGGERLLGDLADDAYYVRPAIVEAVGQTPVVLRETFAPILYMVPFETIQEAIALNNEAPHGLSSSIFTRDQAAAELFMSAEGSDCGLVNVNIGTSGAEIGGAFGGEKETGGGRESGSDAWRSYMRRATNTINYSGELPLAQGVRFEI